jgi:Ca-activated chloride channel family protein
MTFAQPRWFCAFAVFPVLVAPFLWNERTRQQRLSQFVATRLQGLLAGTVSIFKCVRFLLTLLGLAFTIVSLAQPRWGFTIREEPVKAAEVFIAIDVSRSMLANDINPNRLERAKLAVHDLIDGLEGTRVGLIAFAGTAFMQAPLTLDHAAVVDCIDNLDTNIIPRGGTNIAEAINFAAQRFGKGAKENRALILFTDGEELEGDTLSAARKQSDQMRIFSVGVGSAEGSLIPIDGPDGATTFVKDSDGKVVKSRLDEQRLRQIAEITCGFYVHLEKGPPGMAELVRSGINQLKEKEGSTWISHEPIERYQWPLAAALLSLVATMFISERRWQREQDWLLARGARVVSARQGGQLISVR